MYVKGGFINVREMEWMAMRWHSLPANFTAKKKKIQLIVPTERNKIK